MLIRFFIQIPTPSAVKTSCSVILLGVFVWCDSKMIVIFILTLFSLPETSELSAVQGDMVSTELFS